LFQLQTSMLIHLSIPSKNSLPSLDEAWRLFISSGDHTEVSSNSLADVITGFWQFYYVVLQSPFDLVHIHLHHWICSEKIWTARICAPRSTVGIRFRSPLAILSLSEGGGGSRIGRASLEWSGLKHLDQRRSSDFGPPLPF
jgi:hypothetical protein